MIELFLERTIAFLLFWGIWMLAPLVIDVSTAIIFLVLVLFYPEKKERESIPDLNFLPLVSIVIPVHDSEDTLYVCLQSIVKQTYPLEKIQIICVNNGSSDNSFGVYSQFQNDYQAAGISWINMDEAGKSIALNAGIYMIKGDYVFNIDSDAWLDENAVIRMVEAFEYDPSLGSCYRCYTYRQKKLVKTTLLLTCSYCEEMNPGGFQCGPTLPEYNQQPFYAGGSLFSNSPRYHFKVFHVLRADRI